MQVIANLMAILFRLAFFAAIAAILLTAVLRNPDYTMREPRLPQLSDPKYLRSYVDALSGIQPTRSSANIGSLEAAAGYVEAAWRAQGFQPRTQTYRVGNNTYRNLILDMGPETSGGIIVIGAHYDTVNSSPGADANASGVATMLELTGLIARNHAELRNRIEFVAYSTEEAPNFGTQNMGSYIHAKSLHDEHAKVKIMVSLESVGYFSDVPEAQRYPEVWMKFIYPTTADFLMVVSNMRNYGAVRKVKDELVAGSELDFNSINAPIMLKGIDTSDHRSYWQFGYPAVMVTDTANFRNPSYHTASDTADRLDYKRMGKLVDGLFRLIAHL